MMDHLREIYQENVRENISLSLHTSARVGGPVPASLIARSKDELAGMVTQMWKTHIPFMVIGAGSNLLASDQGMDKVLIINRSNKIDFMENSSYPTVEADSGVMLNVLCQKAANLGLSGLEWASSIPGTLGGAVYGNAGAFGGEIATSLVSVDLMVKEKGLQTWTVEKMGYSYRSSIFKRMMLPMVILSATLILKSSTVEDVRKKMDENTAFRKASQPKGASMGSIFKNPPGSHAGKLIEAAGLKGQRVGNAQISPQHANFIINLGNASAADIRSLIELAQSEVKKKSGVDLELEIEMIGEW